MHEAGHILAAWLIGGELPQIKFSIAGIKLKYYALAGAAQQITVGLAGPFVNILMGLILYNKKRFALISLGLGVVNLLPVSCLDGGNIFRAATEKLFLPQTAYRLNRAVSVATIILVFAVNCAVQLKYGTNISLAIITVYLVYRTVG